MAGPVLGSAAFMANTVLSLFSNDDILTLTGIINYTDEVSDYFGENLGVKGKDFSFMSRNAHAQVGYGRAGLEDTYLALYNSNKKLDDNLDLSDIIRSSFSAAGIEGYAEKLVDKTIYPDATTWLGDVIDELAAMNTNIDTVD